MSFNSHLQTISVVHSGRPKHAYLNPDLEEKGSREITSITPLARSLSLNNSGIVSLSHTLVRQLQGCSIMDDILGHERAELGGTGQSNYPPFYYRVKLLSVSCSFRVQCVLSFLF
jgi:hypothetical protein